MENKIISITNGNIITFDNGNTKKLDLINEYNEFKNIKSNFSWYLQSKQLTKDEIEKISHKLMETGTKIKNTNVYNNYYDILPKYYEKPDDFIKINHTDTIDKNNKLVFMYIGNLIPGDSRYSEAIIYVFDEPIDFNVEEYDKFANEYLLTQIRNVKVGDK